MILVGTSGGIRQGKTTVARMLRDLAGVSEECDLEFSYVISEVLNAWIKLWPQPLDPDMDPVDLANNLIKLLPPVLEQMSGKPVTYEQLAIDRTESSLAFNATIVSYLGTWRKAGDRLGDHLPLPITPQNKHLHRDLLKWIGAAAAEKIDGKTWGDMNAKKIQVLKAAGKSLVTVGGVRSQHDSDMIHDNGGVVLRVHRPGAVSDTNITEAWMGGWEPDIEVINNGTLEQLEVAVKQLWTDLQAGTTQKRYAAV